MNKISPLMKLRYIHIGIAVFCMTVMVISFIAIMLEEKISDQLKIFLTISIQIGGAFFFALTAGYVSEALQRARGYSNLWLFCQEFRKAGVVGFYADRDGDAKTELDETFKAHQKGEVLMAGASLRKFLASGQPHNSMIRELLTRKGVSVRAVFSSSKGNRELPVRSFIESFNRGKKSPKIGGGTFDLEKKIDFSFDEFVETFDKKYGDHTRVITDIKSVQAGSDELIDIAAEKGSAFAYRESKSAPYCTLIIFPEKAFYTPNLLCREEPVNMPMIVFHKSSDAYKKILQYFKFLWWVSPEPALRTKNV